MMLEAQAVLARRCCATARVSLGKQEPPKPGPALQELGADAAVEAHALGHHLDVGAQRLAELARPR